MVFLQLCTILIFKVKVNKYKKKKSSLPESLLAGQLKEKKKESSLPESLEEPNPFYFMFNMFMFVAHL